ncbi:MAG: hypothetical protein IIA19_09350 [Thaumarchaeota archaeon]|nr:hypothetical protein [Nitrososphaerota archaeon]
MRKQRLLENTFVSIDAFAFLTKCHSTAARITITITIQADTHKHNYDSKL